jgi:hypothetical protein
MHTAISYHTYRIMHLDVPTNGLYIVCTSSPTKQSNPVGDSTGYLKETPEIKMRRARECDLIGRSESAEMPGKRGEGDRISLTMINKPSGEPGESSF